MPPVSITSVTHAWQAYSTSHFVKAGLLDNPNTIPPWCVDGDTVDTGGVGNPFTGFRGAASASSTGAASASATTADAAAAAAASGSSGCSGSSGSAAPAASSSKRRRTRPAGESSDDDSDDGRPRDGPAQFDEEHDYQADEGDLEEEAVPPSNVRGSAAPASTPPASTPAATPAAGPAPVPLHVGGSNGQPPARSNAAAIQGFTAAYERQQEADRVTLLDLQRRAEEEAVKERQHQTDMVGKCNPS